MNTIRPHFSITALAFIALTCFRSVAHGAAPDSTEWWRAFIASNPAAEVARSMKSATNPRWPEVSSIRQYAGTKEVAKLTLVTELHRKLVEEFKRAGASRATVEVFIDISSQLQRSAGYTNLLLADCINRMIGFGVSGWLVDKTLPAPEVEAVFAKWEVPSVVDCRAWLERFQDDDVEVKARASRFDAIERGKPFEPLQLGYQPPTEAFAPESLTFERLVENPAVIPLLYRFLQTEQFKTVNVRSLILYERSGGSRDELQSGNLDLFLSRIGKEASGFVLPYLRVRRLDLAHPSFCYKVHDGSFMEAGFMGPALR